MNQAAARDVAVSGSIVLLTGTVGAALERGWPSASNPTAVCAFIEQNRAAILAQSVAFSLSAVCYPWFFAALRLFLSSHERESTLASNVVLGAGLVSACLQLVAQAFQIGAALGAGESVSPVFLWTMWALFAIGNLPFGIGLLATALSGFETHAFPQWLSATAVLAAIASFVLSAGAVLPFGLLAADSWLTYALYPTVLVWLVAVIAVSIRKARQVSAA